MTALVWVSGFVGAGLAVAVVTECCGMGMFIAKLPWDQRSGGLWNA